jgi:hypothetical protein
VVFHQTPCCLETVHKCDDTIHSSPSCVHSQKTASTGMSKIVKIVLAGRARRIAPQLRASLALIEPWYYAARHVHQDLWAGSGTTYRGVKQFTDTMHSAPLRRVHTRELTYGFLLFGLRGEAVAWTLLSFRSLLLLGPMRGRML